MPNFTYLKNDAKSEEPKEIFAHNLIRDLASQLHFERIDANAELLKGIAHAATTAGTVNDGQYLQFWDHLQHPPLSYTGDSCKSNVKYRTADGSNNNVMYPHIGRSGSYYDRSVVSRHVSTRLPDPSIIFDVLLARHGAPKPHPNQISSMLFAMATLIIHDLFRTSGQDPNVVDVSSYLDLSPLYGATQDAQNSVRTMKHGKLKPDAFAETRLLAQPPEAAVLLIMFNRFHNYIFGELASINEAEKFSLPIGITEADTGAYAKAIAKRDNDLFQTARLVTSALYMKIITGDYFRTILNLQRTDSERNLDIQKDYNDVFGTASVQKGIRNRVSAEFNLIYRWQSVTSARNDAWLNDFFQKIFLGFRSGMRAWVSQLPTDPSQRIFTGLQRDPDGSFNDSDLVRILTEATEDHVAMFGARHVTVALKAVEVMGIQQARKWGVASLNEVRKHFGMLPHNTFLDLEARYGDVDNVELYPGLVVEEAKKPMTPGSGLCAGFTITRAILSDAVALFRGDRFYTVNFTPVLLTAFGYREVSTDISISGGGLMYKLIMRAFRKSLPHRGNSTYVLFPFTIPSEVQRIQQSLGHAADYDYTPPCFFRKPVVIKTWKGVDNALLYSRSYRIPYGKGISELTKYEWVVGNDTRSANDQRNLVRRALYGVDHGIEDIATSTRVLTEQIVRERSHKLRDIYELDVVKDIAALTWTRFAAFLEQLGLKSGKDRPLLPNHGTKLLHRCLEGSGKTFEEITAWVILLAACTVHSGAPACAEILDFFFQEPYYSKHWPEIQSLASDSSAAVTEKLRKYVLEALRLVAPFQGTFRIATSDGTLEDGAVTRSIKREDIIFLDFKEAGRNPSKFPLPTEIHLGDLLDRPEENFVHFSRSMHTYLGRYIAVAGLTEQLRLFGKLKGLRRAPGSQGTLKMRKVGAMTSYLSNGADAWESFPTRKYPFFVAGAIN
ncbi:heme peroxidase [Bimuria novae-zelandiae CBS 107.79]|uniref:Heme peroxidase n=1 Tax=Bimuria novae-zelandiae CBS 107.79 TaxID=1447943 RepID=A0A6A5VJX5_9PLEO|nr:heme peroxidase [Bimuria novae-zelandiae CBS 107.79]